MYNYDIICFLEYYADRAIVRDPITGKRSPTARWQNFYQTPQALSIDADITGAYPYLAFDASGFGSTTAESINNFQVNAAAVAYMVDITEEAVGGNSLIIASLVIQDVGQDAIDPASAEVISRYIGSIESASITDTAVDWVVNPAIDKQKGQVPSRKISSNLIGRFIGQ
jgi:hypothetical protein